MIREIAIQDMEEWVQMRTKLWPSDGHRAEIIAYFNGERTDPAMVLVATTDDGASMGFIELSVRLDSALQPHGFIEGIFVKPEFRGQRIFKALLHQALNWSAQNGCVSMLADRGVRLYEIHHSGIAGRLEAEITEEELHARYPLRS